MAGSGRSGAIHRVVTAVVALALATAGIVALPAPAAAVHAVPWRFTTVTVYSSISGYNGAEPIKGWTLQCPAGYTAASGGIAAGDETPFIYRLLEYPNPADGTYHIILRNANTNGTAITLTATCVWLDDVGDITTVYAAFARSTTNGRAGGTLLCPEGTTVLSAGTDWNSTSQDKKINFSSPVGDANGQGGGWYTAGYSPISGDKLNIELRCVSAALLAGEYITADDSTAASPGQATAKAVCTTGYRILTGGAAPAGTKTPLTDQGWDSVSGPLDYRQWPVSGYQTSGVTLRALALCVPASTVSVTYTQTPAALSTASSGTITFSAVDTAGETVAVACFLDGGPRGCSSGSPVGYGPLLDGPHVFVVNARNQSGINWYFEFHWLIDATVPVISNHAPTTSLSVTGPITLTFSEPVDGVNTSSVIVHAETANVDVGGTIARPTTTTATWRPNTTLVPGETYRVSVTAGVHDIAGNPLTATFFTVRAVTSLEETSAALQRYWDLDYSTIASGGAYIVSRLAGSSADLTFSATAGQTASVYGIRQPSGGYADIYLDGVKVATPGFYYATAVRTKVYLSPALTAGKHTISIRPLGTRPAASTDSWVAIDSVTIGATVKQESSFKQIFRHVTATGAYGGFYDDMTQTTETDATPARFRLSLVGTGFKVYATKTSASGTAKVYVDGVLKATINLNAASTVYRALVYSTTFPLGQHVVRIEAVGTASGANSSFNVDRITIN
jgi:hypothetical protein